MIIRPVLFIAVFVTAFSIAGISQTGQVHFAGSYLKGTGDNKSSLWGGGIGAKAFIGQNFGIGAKVNAYPKKTSSVTIGDYKYSTADLVTNAAVTFDFLLVDKTSMIQPYLGADAGVSFNNQTVSYSNSSDQNISNKTKDSHFLLSPKAGLNIGLGQAFGIFGQAQYNFTFGDGSSVRIADVPNPFTTKPVSKYFTFDAGIYYRFMPAR